jgi:hypothetical protein
MTPSERLKIALHSPEPAQVLRSLVLELAMERHTKAQILELLEQLRACKDNSEADEEIVLDIMDAVPGWCHPTAALFSDSTTTS